MGKYDVDILVKSRDEVGPGLDSARSKFSDFILRTRKDATSLFETSKKAQGDFVNLAAKSLAAVGSIEAGFKGAAGVVSLLQGNTEEALHAFESLPFGIGPAIAAVHSLSNAFNLANKKAAEVAKRIDELYVTITKARSDRQFAGLSGVDLAVAQAQSQAQAKADELQKTADDALNEARKFGRGTNERAGFETTADIANQERLKVLADFQRDRERLIEEHNDKVKALAAKQAAEFIKGQEDAQQKALKQQADWIRQQGDIYMQGLAEWDAAVAEMDKKQEENAKRREKEQDAFDKLSNGDFLKTDTSPTGLATGSQSRFLTGAAEASRDRLAVKSVMIAEEQKRLLGQAVDALKKLTTVGPLRVVTGVF